MTDTKRSTSDDTGFVREFDSQAAADLAKAMLDAAGVGSWLEVISLSAGVPSRFRLRVDSTMAHRASWVLEESDVTERELTYLATGELAPEDEG